MQLTVLPVIWEFSDTYWWPGDCDCKCYLVLLSHCRKIQRCYLKLVQGHFFPYILSDLSLINNCDSLYTRNRYQMADSRLFCCFVAAWIRRIIIVATTRLMTIRVATTGEIIVPIWDVVVTVGEVVTGPRQRRTVTHDTLTWLLSMYCSGARVGAPICPGMGVVLAMCSSCTFNERDPVNCVIPKKG